MDINSKIPTDGLLLRGFYNAITLAVYGTLSASTAEQLAAGIPAASTAGVITKLTLQIGVFLKYSIMFVTF